MNSKTILNRVINPSDFYEKRFKPSLQTKGNFVKIFSLVYPHFNNEVEIKSLEWNTDRFNLMLLDKTSGEILHMTIKDNFGIKKCQSLLCTDKLCNGVHYEVQNEHFLKFLVYFLVKGVDITFESLLKILCSDIKAKKEYYQIFWKANRPPFSIIQDWAHPLHKFRFMLHEGTFRNVDQSIKFNLPEASIHHSERECQGISPNNKDKGYHFFNFPGGFYDHTFDKYYYLSEEEKKEYIEGKNMGYGLGLSTDLNENDIVMGEGTDKLSKAISYAVDQAKERNIKMISFNCCCVPRIVGDDIYSVLKKAKEKIDLPFIFQGQLEKTPYEQKILLLENYLEKIDITGIEKREKSISLFGYHESIYQKYLGDILQKNGVKINTSFIPTIDVRLLPLMYASELFVFSPNSFQKEVFEYPFKEINNHYIEPKYPYGIKNTSDWLSEICQKLGGKYELSADSQQLIDEFEKKKNIISERGYRVGVALVGKQELKKYLSPDYMNNIDLVEFLNEMGFGIDFFIYDDFSMLNQNNDENYKISDGNHEDMLEILKEKGVDLSKNKVYFYSNENEFGVLLKESNISLMYSDVYFDNRISSLGINQFNLKHFHVGYNGALETVNSLLRLCNTSFYKNYSQYFSN